MSTTHLAQDLPASLLSALDEDGLTVAQWEALTDEERQELGLTVEDHTDAYAGCTDEDMAALAEWLAQPWNPAWGPGPAAFGW